MNKKILNLEKIFISLIIIFSISGGLLFGFIVKQIQDYSGLENLKKFQPSIPTRIYDVNGELIAELFREKRKIVPFKDLPKGLINAFLAAEDRDFYSHIGIDPVAIIRAMVKNVGASISAGKLKIVQGGSTITQQLAKRLFTESERTIARKAVEAVLALQIEKKFSKNEILEMYFNQIYLGHGCHGIDSAAKFYFNKNVKNLSLIESSILAALPSKPNGFSPLKYPREAIKKNQDTLRRMVDANFISKEYSEKIFQDFWPPYIDSLKTEFPTKTALSKSVINAPYFTDYVRQILFSRFGEDTVYTEGLNVYTTLDLKRQRIAEKHLSAGLAEQDALSSKFNERFNSNVDKNLIDAYNNLRLLFSLPAILIKKDIETKFKKAIVDRLIDSLDILTLLTGEENINEALTAFRDLTTSISSSMNVEGAIISIEPKTGYITSIVGVQNTMYRTNITGLSRQEDSQVPHLNPLFMVPLLKQKK